MEYHELPYEVQTLIDNAKRRCIEGNTADYRGTTESELEEIVQQYSTAYERGQALIAGITPEEEQVCRTLFKHDDPRFWECNIDQYVWLDNRRILAPAYAKMLAAARDAIQTLAKARAAP